MLAFLTPQIGYDRQRHHHVEHEIGDTVHALVQIEVQQRIHNDIQGRRQP